LRDVAGATKWTDTGRKLREPGLSDRISSAGVTLGCGDRVVGGDRNWNIVLLLNPIRQPSPPKLNWSYLHVPDTGRTKSRSKSEIRVKLGPYDSAPL